jgi:hypothetical protein
MVGNYILLDHFGDSNVPNSVHGYEWSSNIYTTRKSRKI